ncbi:hypothetical protein BDW69DRAFT_28311 [Aspergillus filifer]
MNQDISADGRNEAHLEGKSERRLDYEKGRSDICRPYEEKMTMCSYIGKARIPKRWEGTTGDEARKGRRDLRVLDDEGRSERLVERWKVQSWHDYRCSWLYIYYIYILMPGLIWY